MNDFQIKYREYLEFFEERLNNYCAEMKYQPPILAESMRYSLLSGGKRVRPVLFFGALDFFGGDYRRETGLALALESIHTYSLIHDDLPAMDNDDYRRGRLSNHKMFGEANAILAGDALLSSAASLLLKEAARDRAHLRAAACLAEAAGADGMIAGQSADLLYTEKEAGVEELNFIYAHKTGKLIAAPIVMAAILTGRDEAAAEQFGQDLGKLFQLTDDILDEKGESAKLGKTTGKDKQDGKLTCVKIYGLHESELLADRTAAACRQTLEKLGAQGSFFDYLVTLVRERDH